MNILNQYVKQSGGKNPESRTKLGNTNTLVFLDANKNYNDGDDDSQNHLPRNENR